MRFQVSDRSGWDDGKPPCEGAKYGLATYLDYRTVKTLEEARKLEYAHWATEWFANGANHREDKEKGMIVRETQRNIWTVNIKGFNALLAFYKKYSPVSLENSDYLEYPLELRINDTHE